MFASIRFNGKDYSKFHHMFTSLKQIIINKIALENASDLKVLIIVYFNQLNYNRKFSLDAKTPI